MQMLFIVNTGLMTSICATIALITVSILVFFNRLLALIFHEVPRVAERTHLCCVLLFGRST
jgi:hypothetical protein